MTFESAAKSANHRESGFVVFADFAARHGGVA